MPAPSLADSLTATVRRDIYPAISPLHALAGSAEGLCVFVTGAGRGIGRAQAIAFAQAGAARIIIGARSGHELDEVEAAIHALGGKTEVIKAALDVTDEASVARAFAYADDVNVLVNNAGYSEAWTRIHEADAAEWWRSWDVNIRGTFLPTRAALQAALARPEQPVKLTVVNTTSVGSIATTPGASGYQSTKSAVNRFTEFLHFEYEAEGVRAFSFHPGLVPTKLAVEAMPEDMHSWLLDTPELAAGFALWLATQGSKVDFLRGRYVSVNWDVDELLALRDDIEGKNMLWTRVIGQEQVHD